MQRKRYHQKSVRVVIFELSRVKLDPDIASDMWPKILQHKWLLSEKVGRDVGFRTACIDFLENMDQAVDEYMSYRQLNILNEMGAQTVAREIWDTISDSQPPKQLVQRRVIASADGGGPFQEARRGSLENDLLLRAFRAPVRLISPKQLPASSPGGSSRSLPAC